MRPDGLRPGLWVALMGLWLGGCTFDSFKADAYDADGDGFSAEEDCDDSSAQTRPSAAEQCADGVDNDCDALIDVDDLDCQTPEPRAADDGDNDGDGSPLPDDCDDTDASIYPGARERCEPEGVEGHDDDCGGTLESDQPGVVAQDCTPYAPDRDGDGVGTNDVLDPDAVCTCASPAASAAVPAWGPALDCDDTRSDVAPDATPTCATAGLDVDCDGETSAAEADPVDPESCTPWYLDGDADDLGDPEVSICTCAAAPPAGYTNNGGDCPGESDTNVYYLDADADGYGDAGEGADGAAASRELCAPDGLYTADYGSDCDDADPSVYPGASERCDDGDRDCDGVVGTQERNTVDCRDYYYDADLDSYGDSDALTTGRYGCFCEESTERVTLRYTSDVLTDCDDHDDAIHPSATELCDGADNDCDGDIDEHVKSTYYEDADGDTWGGTRTAEYCPGSEVAPYVSRSGDCDDDSADVYPYNAETCDGVDNDCDAVNDEGVTGIYYKDADHDNYGNPDSSANLCAEDAMAASYVSNSRDCDDTDDDVKPSATEVCDGQDNDCDGNEDEGLLETWFWDEDDDGFGGDVSEEVCPGDEDPGYVENNDDCDDSDPTLYPELLYHDADGDGYAATRATGRTLCPTSGYVESRGDCDDTSSAISPMAEEVCDGVDNDCDDDIDDDDPVSAGAFMPGCCYAYPDEDSDDYGEVGSTWEECICEPGDKQAFSAEDCDDHKKQVHPLTSSAELPGDGVDQDCDGDDTTRDAYFVPTATYLPADDTETGFACWLYVP